VNSPLLLELPPCGQVQVTKASEMLALCLRALIRNGMGNHCNVFFHSFMYQLLKHVVEVFIVVRDLITDG